MSEIGYAPIEPPCDSKLLVLAESNFDGECPVPQKGESPYTISFYKTIYVLLERIRRLEAMVVKGER